MTRPAGFWTAWAVLAIVVGAWLRLTALSSMEFKGDEQALLTLAMRLLDERPWLASTDWPTHGIISSNGVGNAPLFTWIVAGMWALAQDPVAVTRMVALTNVVCLYPLWLWARRRMDEQRALLTLAICAVSPFAVILSRKIWAPDVMLPGILAVLWGIEWLRTGRPWRGVVLLLGAALVVGQLHQSGPIALVLLPLAFGVQSIASRRRGEPAIRFGRPTVFEGVALVAALALNLFFWLPHLDYLLALPPGTFAKRPLTGGISFQLLSRTERQVIPRDLFYFFEPHEFLENPVRWMFYYGAIGLATPLYLYGLWRWVWSPFSLPVLGVWWAGVIVAFGLARIPAYPWYVLTLAPLPAVLAAGAFDGPLARDWMPRAFALWRVAYVAALLGLAITTGVWLVERGGADGEYGIAYAVRLAQAKSIQSRMAALPNEPFYDLGELRPGEQMVPACGPVPVEMRWLVRWIDPSHRQVPDSFQLCDRWTETGGVYVYRWTLKEGE